MIVAVGYKSTEPPVKIKHLLGGELMIQKSIVGIHGYISFCIQDLEAYRTENGGILPVIGMKEISWREDSDILIGEVK